MRPALVRRRPLAIAMASAILMGVAAQPGVGAAPPDRPPAAPSRSGSEHPPERDFERHADCPHGYRMRGTNDCTHGPDGATADAAAAEPVEFPDGTGPNPVFCFGSGTDGNRVEVVYVRYDGEEDRYSQFRDSFRAWVAAADAVFADSAFETRGIRRVRWVTDSDCNVVVRRAMIPVGSGVGEGLKPQGFNRTDRKYLVFLEKEEGDACGYAGVPSDDRAGASNRANFGPTFAVVKSKCGWNAGTIAHELMHTIGGVQNSAPNASGGMHCTDEYDVMCYSDTPDYPDLSYVCTPGSRYERLFDCRHDDYFHTAPPDGSYLATRWNTADSVFLEKGTSHWMLSQSGLTTPVPWRISASGLSGVAFADVDGDGTDDALRSGGGRWFVARSGRWGWRPFVSRTDLMTSVRFGDFNGDGADDAFRTVDGMWQYSSKAQAAWRVINRKPEPVTSLALGDFDGDGRADVVRSAEGHLQVAWSGQGGWQLMKPTEIGLRDLRFGDFDGNGTTDVFRANGRTWYVSYSNTTRARWTPWTAVAASSVGLPDLAFGMFNGDSTIDVFRATGSNWYVSYSTTDRTTWSTWRWFGPSQVSLSSLRLPNLQGDRRADPVWFASS